MPDSTISTTIGGSGAADNNGQGNNKAFKDDSAELGVMMHKYFDCSGLDDQLRYTDTVEKLQIYVGETYKPIGKQIKVAIGDPSKTPKYRRLRCPKRPTAKEIVLIKLKPTSPTSRRSS
jgi:hypothetical protein